MKEFSIYCDLYDFNVQLIFEKDIDKATIRINELLESTLSDIPAKLGWTFFRQGYPIVVWMPSIPKTPKEIGTITHEFLHVVFEILRVSHLPLSRKSEEAYTYLLSFLVTKFYEEIRK
jgi:hypothetical protein